MANSAKHKMLALLHLKLKPENVYVGEVVVLGMVKGTPFDNGSATIAPKTVADEFWSLFTKRSEATSHAD